MKSLAQAGAANLKGKTLINLANLLDSSTDLCELTVWRIDCSRGKMRRPFPKDRVIKSLHISNSSGKEETGKPAERGDVFMDHDDMKAMTAVIWILRDWSGWKSFVHLDGPTPQRVAEMNQLRWQTLRRRISLHCFDFKVAPDVVRSALRRRRFFAIESREPLAVLVA